MPSKHEKTTEIITELNKTLDMLRESALKEQNSGWMERRDATHKEMLCVSEVIRRLSERPEPTPAADMFTETLMKLSPDDKKDVSELLMQARKTPDDKVEMDACVVALREIFHDYV